MSSGHIRFGRPRQVQLDQLLERARSSVLTYDHIGSTLAGADPRRAVRRRSLVLGHGPQALRSAALGLRRWSCHEGIGATVHPAGAPIEVGSSLLVVLHIGPVTVVVPNRVVTVVDEPTRFGFAYGTLDGHQERGEESFVAELLGDGTVRGTISVDAQAAMWPARLASPAVLGFQRLAVARYLSVWRSFVGVPGR